MGAAGGKSDQGALWPLDEQHDQHDKQAKPADHEIERGQAAAPLQAGQDNRRGEEEKR